MDDLRDLIIRIDARTEKMEEYAVKRDAIVDKRLDSHSGRIAFLEKWQAGVAMCAAAAVVIAGVAVHLLK